MNLLRSFVLDKKLFNATLYASIFKVWFAGLPISASAPGFEQLQRWFGVGANATTKAKMDGECRSASSRALASIGPENFPLPEFIDPDSDRANYSDIAHPFVGQLEPGTEGTTETPANAALGLALLLDQMPRNIFREKQGLIYGHYDRISRAVTSEVYARRLDRDEALVHSVARRMWFYLPLMHSESMRDHEVLRGLMGEMKTNAEERQDAAAAAFVTKELEFETRHVDILSRFGRYPYRNEALGRSTTAEEREWLEKGGETFGV